MLLSTACHQGGKNTRQLHARRYILLEMLRMPQTSQGTGNSQILKKAG